MKTTSLLAGVAIMTATALLTPGIAHAAQATVRSPLAANTQQARRHAGPPSSYGSASPGETAIAARAPLAGVPSESSLARQVSQAQRAQRAIPAHQGTSGGPTADFYDIPTTVPSSPGEVVKSEDVTAYIFTTLSFAKIPGTAQRVMYTSTGDKNVPNVVTATTLLPRTAWTGAGTRPIVVVAPSTQGMGDQCAPSKQLTQGTENEALFYTALLLAGYAVIVTDYAGWGTALPNSYVSRVAEGNAVLDAGRAAKKAGLPGIDNSTRVLLAGYSQGGGAVASASELAGAYAPDLNIIGAYAGGVPADLTKVAQHAEKGFGVGLLLDAGISLSQMADVDIIPYLSPNGRDALAFANSHCVIADSLHFAFTRSRDFTSNGHPLTSLLLNGGPLERIVKEQKIGNGTPKFPIFVGHSYFDEIVPMEQSKTMAKQWCSRNAKVTFRTPSPIGHVVGFAALLPSALTFLAERVEGYANNGNCGSF